MPLITVKVDEELKRKMGSFATLIDPRLLDRP